VLESEQLDHYLSYFTEAFAEALTGIPTSPSITWAPRSIWNKIRRPRKRRTSPSSAASTASPRAAGRPMPGAIQEAGADALELNIYYIPTELGQDGLHRTGVGPPVCGPRRGLHPGGGQAEPLLLFDPQHGACAWPRPGADGLVLFNRFYQPDLDLESLEVVPNHALSTSEDMRLPLRWVALLYGRMMPIWPSPAACTPPKDVLKGLMAGAKVTMMASELLQNGFGASRRGGRRGTALAGAARVRVGGADAREHEPGQVGRPVAFERANYMRVLQSWRPDPAGQLYREMLR
jgi:dihydroorotate dehydrogenase (fumarate)